MEWNKVREKFSSFKNNVLVCWSAPRVNTCYEYEEYTTDPQDSEAVTNGAETPRPSAKSSCSSSSRFLSTGFSLIGYTFLLQLALHLMTFLLNGLAYRRLDTTSLGLVNVRIGLFYSTMIFIARDAFRRACLSRGGDLITQSDSEHSSFPVSSRLFPTRTSSFAGLIDLTWSILPLGAILGSALLGVWIWVLPSPSRLASADGELKLPAELIDQQYVHCLLVYALSGLLELSTESFWLVCQLTHRVRDRILIEAFANAVRAIGIVAAILFVSPNYAIYSLGLPQILHGSTLFITYLCYFFRVLRHPNELDFDSEPVVQSFGDLFPRFRQVHLTLFLLCYSFSFAYRNPCFP
ncbi:unnamed protein product [Echinostoma caproni]|uniref:Protein RFT1 homolog n=1 Tax=Echinostoma caproni TaxID=27848 RepID=A0A183AWQ0_9TREM|nr:unnamed protein product [Echinostoma caproni]